MARLGGLERVGALRRRAGMVGVLAALVPHAAAATTAALLPTEADCPRPIRSLCVRLSADVGYQAAIAPFLADTFRNSQQEARWRLSMEPYVPVILAGLESPAPCERLAALELALHAPGDARILEVLISFYKEGPDPVLRAKLLAGVALQAGVLGGDEELRQLMLAALRDPGLTMSALHLAEAVARPEDVEEMGEVFLALGGSESNTAWFFVETMLRIGGPGVADVLRRALEQHPDSRLATNLVRVYFPERTEERGAYVGGDVLELLTHDLGVLLRLADAKVVLPALYRAQVLREGSGEEKRRYWEACAALFSDRPEMLGDISLQLARACRDVDELGRAVEAMRTALELLPAARGKYFRGELEELQCRLAVEKVGSAITARIISRGAAGKLEVLVHGEDAVLRPLRGKIPIGFVDALDAAGVVVDTVPARASVRDVAGGIEVVLTAGEKLAGVERLRARLLFLPRSPDDVRVALHCELPR